MSDNPNIGAELGERSFIFESLVSGFKGIDRDYQLIALYTLVEAKNEIEERESSGLPEDSENWKASALSNFKKHIGADFIKNGEEVVEKFESMLGENTYKEFSSVFNNFLEKAMLYFIDQGEKPAPAAKFLENDLAKAA